MLERQAKEAEDRVIELEQQAKEAEERVHEIEQITPVPLSE